MFYIRSNWEQRRFKVLFAHEKVEEVDKIL